MDHDENHCDACDSPIDDHRCKGCESGMSFRDDSSECTGYCDGCAQNRMLELEADNAKLKEELAEARRPNPIWEEVERIAAEVVAAKKAKP